MRQGTFTTLINHEWLARHGGSENVFEQLLAAVPGATSMCLWNDAPERFGSQTDETWLARTPLRRSKALSLPFHHAAWQGVDLTGVDRVISSSHAFGHHLASRAANTGIDAYAYVHTPARYVWAPSLDQRGQNPLARGASVVLKKRDRRHTSDAVSYAANSQFVRSRIRASWSVDSRVIYPPVAVDRIQATPNWADVVSPEEAVLLDNLPRQFVLGASRLVDYKRLDLPIKVGGLLGMPVVIAGDGPQRDQLATIAERVRVPVKFVGRVSDALLFALYQRASLFVFMPVEDFGIMPVEAMALGTPVLANAVGGGAESVRLASGGAVVNDDASDQEVRTAAVKAMDARSDTMRQGVRQFSEAAFREHIRSWVREGTSPQAEGSL
ncbi:glycosyltransferase [Aeromicrobium sp. CFBP 8757]|uniref:glycosyltransferase n=1 Tax=Aeromicrobium sp. CFBP 8757 TaxID=2775288 RepID=UPI0017856A09|nr:glycosyltransferase [Aeromicrobium sp. CFBP 8757]MBD8608529.1 glycosyltransferase [Aeromicrobium sp. CFBP 8757]